MLKYPDVAGMGMGGICEVTMNTSAAKIAAMASLSGVLCVFRFNPRVSGCYWFVFLFNSIFFVLVVGETLNCSVLLIALMS